jgi:hypothetical protein
MCPDLAMQVFEILAGRREFALAGPFARDLADFERLLQLDCPPAVWAGVGDAEGCLSFLMDKLEERPEASLFVDAVALRAEVRSPPLPRADAAQPEVLARCVVEQLDPNKASRQAAAGALVARACDVSSACSPAQFATLAGFAFSVGPKRLQTALAGWAAGRTGAGSGAGMDAVVAACDQSTLAVGAAVLISVRPPL